MGIIQTGLELLEENADYIEDLVNALSGDEAAITKFTTELSVKILTTPFFLREKQFWKKIRRFFEGEELSKEDLQKFCKKISKKENAERLIALIDKIDIDRKIDFIRNAALCLANGFIDQSAFFRISSAVADTLYEDLIFLRDNIIEKEEFDYSLSVQGLLSNGLMYQSVISGNGDQKYRFTEIGEMVDRFAVSYRDVNRYPDPTSCHPGHEDSPKRICR